jgi:short-subunit dehydrogenase
MRYGPWALVAGASEGLGAAFARALAGRGLNVVLVARRAEVLEQVKEQIVRLGAVQVRCLPLDLARSDAPTEIEASVADLDVGLVVYNAAFAPIGPFLGIPLDEQLRAIDVNVRAPLTLAHRFGNRLAARGRGGLVLLSSLTAFQGSPFVATYGASKAFDLALAEGLWFELAPRGIDVLAVCPGATRTPGYLRRSPLGAPGELEPEQVVEAALTALGRGPLVIPGRFNRLASLLMRRMLPRRRTISIMGARTRRLDASSAPIGER